MSRPFSMRELFYPKEKHVWVRVRIIRETDRAVLVDNGARSWVPKSRICGIRLRKDMFEIYVKEGGVG